MATYKVLQDIEADDKLLGPLSLKQFIFAIVTIGLAFIQFRTVTTAGLGIFRWLVLAIFLPPTLLFGILAAPIGKDQPTEVWLLARIRFFFKPRVRIWNQEGAKQLVTITAPKKIIRQLTKDFTQDEALDRLGALASVMDTRGWAVKNSDINMSTSPEYGNYDEGDRLVQSNILPQEVSSVDITAADDIMDEANNSTARQFEQMIEDSEKAHSEELKAKISQARQRAEAASAGQAPVTSSAPATKAADQWFDKQKADAKQPAVAAPTPAVPTLAAPPVNYVVGGGGQAVAPNTEATTSPQSSQPAATAPTSPDEEALLEKVHKQQELEKQISTSGHEKRIETPEEIEQKARQTHLAQLKAEQQAAEEAQQKAAAAEAAKIASLARDNDKTVATLARQANKPKPTTADGEVVISLH